MRGKSMAATVFAASLFIFPVFGTVVIAAQTAPAAHAAGNKEKVPSFRFENKHYSLDCRDTTPGACEQLDAVLRNIDRYRKEIREYREMQEEMNRGVLPRKIRSSISNI
jgi:hypothetical protein